MSIKDTLEYIHNVKWQGSKPGLDRTRELLQKLGNPEKELKFVHVAGTNGKGSTCICIANVLKQAGYKTGLYISPFVLRFNERMQVDGVHISDEELEQCIDEIRPFADAMEDSPTEFELITALAMKHFLNKGCDIVVLEVGMGGRLDSTNVIDTPELAVITAIGFDHVKELGPTITDIAREKAGIIKPGGDVVIYGGEPEVVEVFEHVASERNAKLTKADFSRTIKQELSLNGINLKIDPYREFMFPLLGAYQPKNVTVAITALEALRGKGYNIKDDDMIKGLESVNWPGRIEILGHDPIFILDGSHNPQGMEVTADSLRKLFGDKKIIFINGVMADKDINAMMATIIPSAKRFITVTPDNPRAMNAHDLAEILKRSGIPTTAHDTIIAGVSEALNIAKKEDVICAMGSLFFSPEIRAAYAEVHDRFEELNPAE